MLYAYKIYANTLAGAGARALTVPRSGRDMRDVDRANAIMQLVMQMLIK